MRPENRYCTKTKSKGTNWIASLTHLRSLGSPSSRLCTRSTACRRSWPCTGTGHSRGRKCRPEPPCQCCTRRLRICCTCAYCCGKKSLSIFTSITLLINFLSLIMELKKMCAKHKDWKYNNNFRLLLSLRVHSGKLK